MPRLDGVCFLKKARDLGSKAHFIMMTSFSSVSLAVEAMHAGADNFLPKPISVDAALLVIKRTLEHGQLLIEATELRERVQARFQLSNMVGDAPALRAVVDLVQQAAPTRATILVLGESGTGKELVAQALHQCSPRRTKPFIKVNCAALSESLLESELFGHERGSFTGALGRREGRFERADGGTLFLDEVGEIPLSLQVKLLRVLQSREFERVGGTEVVKVDIRLIAATNRDLEADVKAGRFREDLFYRLNVVPVVLPPLRERKCDLPALVSHFLAQFSTSYGKPIHGLAPGTLKALMSHDWPGNIRELENAIERAVVLAKGRELTADDLPSALRGPRPEATLLPGSATMAQIERQAIMETLQAVNGSTSRAADVLGISIRKIQYRLNEYGERRARKPVEKLA
jgi:two-component system NtrC family response regulator/two-component system response regulator HydG